MIEAAPSRTYADDLLHPNDIGENVPHASNAQDATAHTQDETCVHVLAAVRTILVSRRGRTLTVSLQDLRRYLGTATSHLLEHLDHLKAGGHLVVRAAALAEPDGKGAVSADRAAHESVRRAACVVTLPEFDDGDTLDQAPPPTGPTRIFTFTRPGKVSRTRGTTRTRARRPRGTGKE